MAMAIASGSCCSSSLASSLIQSLSLFSHSSFFRGDSFLPPSSSSSSSSFPKLPLTIEAAHKKGSGSTKNGRDSAGKRLGVKIYGDQAAKAGSIIIRQRGTKVHPGNNVGLGRDYTIFSLIDGVVKFEKFGPDKKKVSVYPKVEQPENPNSRKAKKREFFRLRRERRRAFEEGQEFPNTLVLASAEPTDDCEEKAVC